MYIHINYGSVFNLVYEYNRYKINDPRFDSNPMKCEEVLQPQINYKTFMRSIFHC